MEPDYLNLNAVPPWLSRRVQARAAQNLSDDVPQPQPRTAEATVYSLIFKTKRRPNVPFPMPIARRVCFSAALGVPRGYRYRSNNITSIRLNSSENV